MPVMFQFIFLQNLWAERYLGYATPYLIYITLRGNPLLSIEPDMPLTSTRFSGS